MEPINLLHLSDLHLAQPVQWDQSVLIEGLLKDLEKNRFSRNVPDLVIFSGDLVSAAGEPDAYGSVLEFLLKIMETVGLGEDRLILCPGNHDVDRRVVGPQIQQLQDFRETARTIKGAISLVGETRFKNYVSSTFHEYSELASAFLNPSCIHSDVLSSSYFLRALGLGVVTLNTASLSAGGLTPTLDDRGKLFVSEKTLVEALDRIPSGIRTIVVGHHPTSWFTDESCSVIERILANRAVAYMSGHLHEAVPSQSRFIGGELLHAQSGALYCGRQYWNGYALLSLSPESGYARLAYRRWFEQRRSFSKAEDLGDDGLFYSSEAAETYWKAITPPIDHIVFEHWRTSELVPAIIKRCNDGLSGAAFGSMFVPPDFEREIPYRQEADGRMGSRVEHLSLNDLISSRINYIVSAFAETGKSTLLKQIALHLANEDTNRPDWSIPAIIQFGSMRSYSSYIEKLIRDSIPDLPTGITVSALLARGMITVLVDDLDFSNAAKRKALITFVSSNPRCRYIFASSTTFVEIATLQPEIAPDVPFTRVRMRPFRKGHLQTLVENHGLTDPIKIDQMVERVMRDASSLNVPLTAVTGTFLIQIIREEPDATVINQAALIERYVEMLLQKYAPHDLLPGAFDFKNKVDLLCDLPPNSHPTAFRVCLGDTPSGVDGATGDRRSWSGLRSRSPVAARSAAFAAGVR